MAAHVTGSGRSSCVLVDWRMMRLDDGLLSFKMNGLRSDERAFQILRDVSRRCRRLAARPGPRPSRRRRSGRLRPSPRQPAVPPARAPVRASPAIRRRRRSSPPPPLAAAAGVGPARRAGSCSLSSSRSAAKGSTRATMTRPGLIAAMQPGDPMLRSRRRRPTASTNCRPTSRSAMSAARTGTDWHIVDKDLDAARQDALLRTALCRSTASPDALARPAADPSAICGAEECAGDHAARPRRPRSTASASTWTAGAGCRATLAQKYIIVNVPAFHATLVENGVTRWKQRGDRRRDQDADAAADRRWRPA